MGLFSKKSSPAPVPEDPGVDWSLLENIRSEWPNQDFDSDSDLASWRQGMALYDARDDYASLIEAGRLMCRALRHHLYGRGVLMDANLPETTHRVLFASCFAPPDGQSFPTQVRAQVRLGLAVVKKHGWQSAEHGGGGEMADYLLHAFMILTAAVAPSPQRSWEGNLKQFFIMNPYDIQDGDSPLLAPAPALSGPSEAGASMLREMEETIQLAEAGDQVAAAKLRAMQAMYRGDAPSALREYETAAQLGDVEAMFEAGSTAQGLGLGPQARYWFETAADRGHGKAALNLGVSAYETQGREAAHLWLERAVAAGVIEAYAVLTQIADEASDGEAELRWSRTGAEHRQPFCQMRYGQLLMRFNRGEPDVIREQCLPLFEEAAEKGVDGALFLGGIAHCILGDPSSGRLWLKRAEASGDSNATRVMREHGLE